MFLSSQMNTMIREYSQKFRQVNTVHIILVRMLFQGLNELGPVWYFVCERSEDLKAFFLKHLDMDETVVGTTNCVLPTFILLASVTFRDLRVILSEVKELWRVNLHANRVLEVFIRDSAIFIVIELVEQSLELFICHVKTPVMQIDLKLFWFNGSWLLMIQVNKSFLQGFPLLLNLL